MSKSVEVGGLGLKRISLQNKAMLIKHIWDITLRKDSLWIAWVHSVELKNQSFWVVPIPQDSSWFWRKLLQLRPLV
mgnify:CR=1 FL=1